jgi:hypothetical protein
MRNLRERQALGILGHGSFLQPALCWFFPADPAGNVRRPHGVAAQLTVADASSYARRIAFTFDPENEWPALAGQTVV